MADFSGYLAADELYDGPFCVLSAVDGPNQHRLLYEVLDHEPDHDDIRRFLGRLQQAIAARGGTVRGITTDGSPLYPEPLAEIFPDVPHQVCEFHILKELTKAVMHVAARIRKQLKAQAPTLPRGRQPNTPEARRKRRRSQTIKRHVAELFEHRHLFVQHRLTAAERATLRRLRMLFLQLLQAILEGLIAGAVLHHGERFGGRLTVGPEEGDSVTVACGINTDADAVEGCGGGQSDLRNEASGRHPERRESCR